MDKFMSKCLFLSAIVVLLAITVNFAAADEQASGVFAGSDLHLRAGELIAYQPDTDVYIMVFRRDFTLTIGDNQLSSTRAVLWLRSVRTQYMGVTKVEYNVEAYLQGDVSIKKGDIAEAAGLKITKTQVNGVKSIVAEFTVTGEVLITAEKKLTKDPRGSDLFKNAEIATGRRVIKQRPVEVPKKTKTPKPAITAGKVSTSGKPVPQKSPKKQIARAKVPQLKKPQLEKTRPERKSTRLNSSHIPLSRMPSSA